VKANVKKKRKKGSNDELRELELELGHTNIDNPPKEKKEKDTQRKEENNQAQQPMIPFVNEEDKKEIKKESLDKLLEKIPREKSYDVSKNSYCNLEDDLEP
jgi:hypothetical protein